MSYASTVTYRIMLQITVEYSRTPPQIFVSRLRKFCLDQQNVPRCHISLQWVQATSPPAEEREEEPTARLKYEISHDIKCKCCTVYRLPRGYRKSPSYPMLRGENHCPHCLCAPCVIALPPDFLKGSCDAHPANAEKRHRLYRGTPDRALLFQLPV